MPKAYWIARVDVTDAEPYKRYAQQLDAVVVQFGGRFLVRAGHAEIVEGASRSRQVAIEFPNWQAAQDCYRSTAYAPLITLRLTCAEVDIVIVEGYEEASRASAT
ncbi:MAG: DUF1330 domain-containing protein [Rubrivivax sp.]|nr:MAG: DUF1330 domain-containing protein [Rubrivivax sp.]